MAYDPQIVGAKESLKLSHGGPSYSQASGTHPSIKDARVILHGQNGRRQMSLLCCDFGSSYFESICFHQRSWVVFNLASCFQGKATATNEELTIVFEGHVSYDLDLPEFGYVPVIFR